MLSDLQIERYSRQIILPEVGARGQERLLKSTIALVVAEPAQSYAVSYLAAAGIGRLCVCTDATEGWVGDVAPLNPDSRIEAHRPPKSYDDWIAAVQPAVVLLEATGEARDAAVNSACMRAGVPLLWGRTAGAAADLALFDGTAACGCLACTDCSDDAAPAQSTALDALAASILASLLATEALKLALKGTSSLLGHGLRIDAASSSIEPFSLDGNPTCPVCTGGSRQ